MNTLPEIIIVDDHDIFRDGLSSLIAIKKLAKVIGEASNGVDLLNMLEEKKPDLVLMDISMPKMDGVEASRRALEKYPDLKILVLSMIDDDDYYIDLINIGVKGFILKSSGKNELERALVDIEKGKTYFSNDILRVLVTKLSKSTDKISFDEQPEIHFTSKELEVLKYLCHGFTAKEIAEKMHLSIKSIDGYRSRLFLKAGVKNVVQLVIYAIKTNLVDLENL